MFFTSICLVPCNKCNLEYLCLGFPVNTEVAFSERHAEFVNTNSKVVSLTKQLENFKAELKKTQATIDAGRLNKAEAKSAALSQAGKKKEDEGNLRQALTQLDEPRC